MGKRKSSRKPQGPKKRDPLPTIFDCLFCNHDKSVTVKIDRKAGTGDLACKVCGQNFQCSTNYLSAPVDVYSEWVDAADAVANEGEKGSPKSQDRPAAGRRASTRRDDLDDIDEIEDEEDERRYEGEGIVADDEDE